MQSLDNYNFAGKKAFVRVDFNVPLDENFNITNDTRMVKALPTLKKILADGGSLIIGSHLGRPKKGPEDKFSLRHIVAHLSELLGTEVKFVDECVGDKVKAAVAALKPGEVLLLENLRFHAEEEGKPRGLAEDASDEEKAAAKKVVSLSELEVGDILWRSGHVGIYIGNGQYVHAPHTGDVVKVSSGVGKFTCGLRYQ